eukprot:CAMPEP_0183816994 /NCGR_PEP_ID=MMETSP0803_2-20130417/59628_1 /TAXON_ID=195967 /ORGANISM="Crustomastix stigmata, Strain CCMP3273" /LENGTH=104 /DNA_ID=CAMNT_0026061879 /DNA_START=346 /DNA_END=660 /DNA_ORIENTATION=+
MAKQDTQELSRAAEGASRYSLVQRLDHGASALQQHEAQHIACNLQPNPLVIQQSLAHVCALATGAPHALPAGTADMPPQTGTRQPQALLCGQRRKHQAACRHAV